MAPVHPLTLALHRGVKRENSLHKCACIKEIKMFPVHPGSGSGAQKSVNIQTMHTKISKSELQPPASLLDGAVAPSLSKSCWTHRKKRKLIIICMSVTATMNQSNMSTSGRSLKHVFFNRLNLLLQVQTKTNNRSTSNLFLFIRL